MKNGMRRKCGNTEFGIRKGSARLGAGTAGFVGLGGISRGRRGFASPNFKFLPDKLKLVLAAGLELPRKTRTSPRESPRI